MHDSSRRYNDYPLNDVVAKAEQLIAKGHTVYQKFTCAGCGARLTVDQPNTFHPSGRCDRCPYVTNIRIRGCNFMVVMSSPTAFDAAPKKAGRP
jgi:hypothetical protein